MGAEFDSPLAWQYPVTGHGFTDGADRLPAPVLGQASRNPMCRKCHRHKRGWKDHPGCTCAEPEFDTHDNAQRVRTIFIAWLTAIMRECLRVLKPGGHALIWALPRTSHWTATAIEDAGFEVRDVVVALFGEGYPKSRALPKPASEHWILARKPMRGSLAANVAECGVGALNIDGCRVPFASEVDESETKAKNAHGDFQSEPRVHNVVFGHDARQQQNYTAPGRWPPNVALVHAPECDEQRCVAGCPVAELDRQSGPAGGFAPVRGTEPSAAVEPGAVLQPRTRIPSIFHNDSGGASRFFPRFRYHSKASTSERELGLDDSFPEGVADSQALHRGRRMAEPSRIDGAPLAQRRNIHPTVKPLSLMQWLCRLVCPPGGTVLDPFAGSGSTGVACRREGFAFIGIERDPHYVEIARARVAAALRQPGRVLGAEAPPEKQMGFTWALDGARAERGSE